MSLGMPVLGAAFSALLMLALAMKWQLPKMLALIGIAIAAIVTSLPFIWIYPLFKSNLGLGATVLGQISVAFALALSLVLLRFWRDPERLPLEKDGVVLSAADGEVVYVWSIPEDSATEVSKKGRKYRLDELTGTGLATRPVHVVGIGMSFLDVHVNRCPISGRVKLMKHLAGKFISLRKAEAPFVNERLTTIIENDSLNVAIVQIASRLVRRIQSYLRAGETVSAGQRLGIIRLGSLVATIIPDRDDVQIEVKPGDRVTAGISVLARYGVGGTEKN
jgi:phosphatidylserine decarboxylase